jgi:hypothetical protein
MNKHRMVSPKELKPKVLDEIGRTHNLAHCPLCGGEFAKEACFHTSGSSEHGASGSSWLRRLCEPCNIVWEMDLINWTNERGDGMVTGEGHYISLVGYANCFCCRIVIDRSPAHIRVHEGRNHSYMHSVCEPRPVQVAVPT